jgi:hypothetical protein
MDLSGAIHGKLWGETGYIWGSKWFKWGWIRFNILAVVWTESMFGYHHWVEILPVVFSNPMSVEACQWLETHSGVWLISRNSAFGKPLRSLKPPRNQYPRKWLEKHPWMAQCTLRGAGRIYKYKDISWNYNMDIYIYGDWPYVTIMLIIHDWCLGTMVTMGLPPLLDVTFALPVPHLWAQKARRTASHGGGACKIQFLRASGSWLAPKIAIWIGETTSKSTFGCV